MDIHKPKAAHSWREFAIEIGTIICGILIALGLEQAVEAMHRGAEVREAREALHREIERNMRIARTWIREHPCWMSAADATERWAEGRGDRPRFETNLMRNYQTVVWDTAKTGAVTHMPLDERLTLANAYAAVNEEANVIEKHRNIATDMGGYATQTRLSPEDAAALIRLTGKLRWFSNVASRNDQSILDAGARLGLHPASSEPDFEARVAVFCRTYPPKP